MLDALIIGGGPAGLNAALVLGRCRRSVVVVDHGRPRNAAARHMHNYLTRDGVEPAEFRRLAHAEAAAYGVRFVHERAAHARRMEGGFEVTLEGGERLRARKLLLATGVRDVLPELPGFERFYGCCVHHCPYCDAWEHRDKAIVAYGKGDAAVGLALALRTWTAAVTACTDGEEPSAEKGGLARRNGIAVRTERVEALEGTGERLEGVRLAGGDLIRCGALFFNTGQIVRDTLASELDCRFKDNGGIETTDRQCTGVRGLYCAGDADKDVQFVIVAAAEGATAAVAINRELQDEERGMG